jgi:periplasmic protein TonB
VTPEPDFFVLTEGSSREDGALSSENDRKRARITSLAVHLGIFGFLLLGSASNWFGGGDQDSVSAVRVRFYTPGAEGPGGGGGGGGSRGRKPTAYIPVRMAKVDPPPVENPQPRKAPVAPRKPRQLNFDDLDVPDLPDETALLFQGVFSPDAVDFPGLSLTDGRDLGGIDTEPSSGTGGGIGGGKGTGVGTGEGWGVGPGRGGGFGGGDYAPGGWDIEPVPIYRPPDPPYPPMAREKMVAGEVILQVLVKLDGSTEVVRVVKSLPFCVEAAKESARLWRWKPALKEGKPVEAYGIITVTFDIFAQGNAKS